MSPRLWPLVFAVVGALIYWPALVTRRFLDDYLHTLMIEGRFPSPRSPFNLYDFVNDADRALFLERQLLPWWTHPEFKVRFYRPLASVLLWFEQRVLHFGIELQHVHSFAWWLACVLAARALFRRVLSERAALLATLAYAFAPAHALPLGWVANRNALVSLTFGALALAQQYDFRARGSFRAALWATLLFTLAVFSGEYALSFGGYVLALELTRRDALIRRFLGVLPFALPALVYLVLRHALDYGTRGSGFYVDPLVDPVSFVQLLPFRLSALLLQGWLTLGTDTWIIGPHIWERLALPTALLVLPVLSWLVRRVHRALPEAARADAQFLLFGSLISALPVLSTVPSPRLMGITLLGIAVQVALILDDAWFPAQLPVRTRAVEWAGIAASLLGFFHFIHGPACAWLGASIIEHDAARFEADVAFIGRRLKELHSDEVVVLRGSVEAFFGPYALRLAGGPWTRWHVLTDPRHLLALRSADDALDLIAAPEDSLTPIGGFNLCRDQTPLTVGESHRIDNFTLTVDELGEYGPTRARLAFDGEPGQGQLWVTRRDYRLQEVKLPAVGFGMPVDR